jgi:hypothetical protein
VQNRGRRGAGPEQRSSDQFPLLAAA